MKPLIVLYYHRILPFKGYDVDVDMFRWQLSFLKKHFDIVDPEVLFDLKRKFKLKKSSVLLTFDDGFLDNYVYAYTVLEELKLKALVFVITSKITNRNPEKTAKDGKEGLFIPKREETALLDSLHGDFGEFLSWDELKIMKESGVFSIGSHSDVHVKIFSSDRVIGIWKDPSDAHWSYEFALGKTAKVGYPIFEMKSALSAKRFYPDSDFAEKVRNIYLECKDEKETIKRANTLENKGYFESLEEFKGRVYKDLDGSKDVIEENLGITTPFLSWPWGEYCGDSLEIARDLGFEFCFSTEKGAFFGDDFCRIGRIKASQSNVRFKRKLLLNNGSLLARMYSLWHR